MRLDVAFSPHTIDPGELAGRTVVVIDVLRATTTICAALAHGARAIVPSPSVRQATEAARTSPDPTVLAGERHGVPIAGFEVGNSPPAMSPTRVGNKTVVLTTTNGTRAFATARAAQAVYPGSVGNFSLVTGRIRQALSRGESVLLLCAGRYGGYGLDDAYFAGRVALAVQQHAGDGLELNAAARHAITLVERHGADWTSLLEWSAAGRHLLRLGYHADVTDASREDAYPAEGLLVGHRITPLTAP